ncbi:MAG: hypothetical protein J6K58_14130 [Lachnospiraceae bacterium]|nr:hypothetical protein [Lachnospiraceae bacterium]
MNVNDATAVSDNSILNVPVDEQSDFYAVLVQAFNDVFNSTLDDHFITIEENQFSLLEYLEKYYGYHELTEEDRLLQEENEQLEQQYKDDLLDTLHNIDAGIVSQNSLLEENNRLLKNSISISENTVSQNSILTTKLEDYSLTDSLLLLVLIFLSVLCFIEFFVRKKV